jgi:hypothetical protein
VVEVTVPVPDDRVAQFYEMFGRWLGGADGLSTGDIDAPELLQWSNSGEDVALARKVWVKLSPRAQALFRLLMSKPGQKFAAEELADTLDIPHGKNGVAGALAWPGRHSHAVGRWLPVRYEDGPVGRGALYWMEPEVAELFRRAMETDA